MRIEHIGLDGNVVDPNGKAKDVDETKDEKPDVNFAGNE